MMPSRTQAHLGMARVDRMLITSVIVLSSVLPIELFPYMPPSPQGLDKEYKGKQGQVLVITIKNEDETADVQGIFLSRTIPFFRELRIGEPPAYVGLLAIDMQDKPGTYELTVTVKRSGLIKQLSLNVLVAHEKFSIEHLNLPKDKVDLDEKSLNRWRAEQEQVKEALMKNSRLKLWDSDFVEPVQGKRTGIFGSVRIINGKPRNPHNGEDIGASMGTPVVASNDGVVRLTVDHIFSGRGIYLDHGLGFYTMYFHLSKVLVSEGDVVSAGQIIGQVGATGRATGPHLHWGAKLNGARVNPYGLLELSFKNRVASRTNVLTQSLDVVPDPEVLLVK